MDIIMKDRALAARQAYARHTARIEWLNKVPEHGICPETCAIVDAARAARRLISAEQNEAMRAAIKAREVAA